MKNSNLILQVLLLVFLTSLLGCSLIGELPGNGSTSSDDATQVDRWIDAALGLRSVNLDLVTTFGWRDPRAISAQIDTSGSIHLNLPLSPVQIATDTPAVSAPGDFELIILDGHSFVRIGPEEVFTQDDNYASFLADALTGPEGPGLWLGLLPEEGFIAAGQETYGGFTTTRYNLQGEIRNTSLSGTIWIDDEKGALIGADLTIPEALFYPPGAKQGGDVKIVLQIAQADIKDISLP
jgi:hypothetical protein